MSNKNGSINSHHIQNEWNLFEVLSTEPEITQADLAARAGVAVGTVNWYLKKWSANGYVKVKRIDRWRWRYLLTSEGLLRKATLAKEFINASMSLYRQTRQEAKRLLAELIERGHKHVVIVGEGEIADVCRLTCLEMGIEVMQANGNNAPEFPQIAIRDATVTLFLNNEERETSKEEAA